MSFLFIYFMINLQQIETDLTAAIKAKRQIAVDTLRGLKARVQNEKIAKTKPELSEDELLGLVRSEIKRRKEAAESFAKGGRPELREKELAEAEILQNYLPAQMSEEAVAHLAGQIISDNNFTAADFGRAMGILKAKVGAAAEGGLLAKILKEKLN